MVTPEQGHRQWTDRHCGGKGLPYSTRRDVSVFDLILGHPENRIPQVHPVCSSSFLILLSIFKIVSPSMSESK